MERLTAAEYRNRLQKSVKRKYHNVPAEYLGMRFDSKREAGVAYELELLKRAGKILTWIRQVSFPLPGGITHRIDFMVINLDKTVRFIEAKGCDHRIGKMKRQQVEEIHGIEIEVR